MIRMRFSGVFLVRRSVHLRVSVAAFLLAGASCETGADSPAPTTLQTTSTTSTETPTAEPPLAIASVEPTIIDPLGNSHLTVLGNGFKTSNAPITSVTIAGISVASFEVLSDTELRITTAPVAPGKGLDLTAERGDNCVSAADGCRATLTGQLEAWSPAEIAFARVFDAESGVETAEKTTMYEWQRLSESVGSNWRVRDGNTTTWFPKTGRFWMVAGWNGYLEPDGFSSVPPDTVYPPENTTGEVWSSADGISWKQELPHGHEQFVRRHSHNTMLWKDKLWMIGGDYHTGAYNHDVVSSENGTTWKVELGPGKKAPPWSERALQVSGVYNGKLWMVGGQDAAGDPNDYVYHNDVWNTDDGINWNQVVEDAPASETRWGGCGVLDGLIEFKGRMWLVGCARERSDAAGHTMINEVWSTTDGAVWKLHAEPPWKGKIWPNVVVWDDKIWILFGYTKGDPQNGWTAGNANEAWFSEDGETWRSLPPDSPVPGSHAQGVAVTEKFLLVAGGNYGFGFGAGVDKSVWRLVPFRGQSVDSWTDRGTDGLRVVPQTPTNRPVLVPDALGSGISGIQFDGSTSFLEIENQVVDEQPNGRSVFWVARAPYLPPAAGWIDFYNPSTTIVGGPASSGFPVSSVGLTDGRIVFINREKEFDELGSPTWKLVSGGSGLQNGVGEVRFAGVTHGVDGAVQLWADGEAAGAKDTAYYGETRSWTRIAAGLDGGGEGPANRFGGTLGAVVILPTNADVDTVKRLHTWAQGRFGAR